MWAQEGAKLARDEGTACLKASEFEQASEHYLAAIGMVEALTPQATQDAQVAAVCLVPACLVPACLPPACPVCAACLPR